MTTAPPFPVPNSTRPFWRTELHELDSHRSTADLPAEQDIIIIGAGFAGAATAYYLLKDVPESGPKPRVTILEAREACSGATGRNGGHLRPEFFTSVVAREKLLGVDVTAEISRFEIKNAEVLKKLIADENIDCDLVSTISGVAYRDEAQAAVYKAAYDAMCQRGSPGIDTAKYYGPEDAEKVSGVKDAVALYTFPSATIWPYKVVMHLLSAAVASGANLQTHTPAQGISPTADSQGYWTVETPRGSTRAKRIVFATNGYTSSLLPEYKTAIVPGRGTCARLKAKDGTAGPAPIPSCIITLPECSDSYWGLRPDGSYIVGDMGLKWRATREQWVGNFDDSKLIESAVPCYEDWGPRNFVGWEKAEMEIQDVWTGIMGYTPDNLPHIGRVPGKDGLFVCAGFIGHGMPNVLLCAKAIVELLSSDSPTMALSGIPACYETSSERLSVNSAPITGAPDNRPGVTLVGRRS